MMLKGLSGFLKTMMEGDTSRLEPFEDSSVLIGFSSEPTGVQAITELTVRGFTSVTALEPGPASGAKFTELSALQGLMDVELRIPTSVYKAKGVNPSQDPEAALAIAHEWTESKTAEIRRLLRLPPSD